MRLKILFVPVAIVLMFVLIISFIMPDYSSMKFKKQELARKEAQAAGVETVLANAESLETSWNSRTEATNYLYRYFPREIDQSRLIDAFNFLATQSGVALSSVSVDEKKEDPTEAALLEVPAQALTSINPELGGGGPDPFATGVGMPYQSPAMSTTPVPKAKNIEGEITIEGSYANVKEFLRRISRLDRYGTLNSFAITERKNSAEPGAPPAADPILSAQISLNLPFLTVAKVSSALSVATFQRSEFDFGPVDTAMAWTSNPVPPLESAPGNKVNPFQP